MLQWRVDDTISWGMRYGTLSKGSKSFGNETIGTGAGAYYSAFSGSSGATTGNAGNIPDGVYGIPCVIMTMQGSIPSDNWQFNWLISVSGGVATFLYPLQHNFGQSGEIAQIITANDFSDIALTGTLSMPAWNGAYGGVGVLFGGNVISGSGLLNGVGLGFRGGFNAGNNTGQRGEGTGQAWNQSNAANGNGAGGGQQATDSGHVEGGNSAGGGNRTAGANGSTRNTGIGGIGGLAVSTQDGKAIVPGGGSGQGGADWNAGGGVTGVSGSGVWITVARRQIWQGGVSIQGQNGNNASGANKSGATGGGAPGCWIAKGQQINVSGSINIAPGVGGSEAGNFGGTGGNSGEGVGHIDYSQTTTAGVDSRLDTIYNDNGAAFFGAFL